jgi:hypothetical protein
VNNNRLDCVIARVNPAEVLDRRRFVRSRSRRLDRNLPSGAGCPCSSSVSRHRRTSDPDAAIDAGQNDDVAVTADYGSCKQSLSDKRGKPLRQDLLRLARDPLHDFTRRNHIVDQPGVLSVRQGRIVHIARLARSLNARVRFRSLLT